jgi:HlyD family secretion protein
MTKVTGRRHQGALLVGLVALFATAACTATPAPPPTVRVDRGIVATSVSASGKLASITEQNLGFPEGGQLEEVLVKVGDQVEAGQVLARLDDFELTQELKQSQAQLAQQQASLTKIRNGNSVAAAQADLDQAKKILDATQKQVSATNDSNKSATDRARVQLDFDKSALDRAERKLREDRADCNSDEDSSSTGTANTGAAPTGTANTGTASTGTTGGTTNAACDRIESDKAAVQDAKRAVVSSETSLDAAKERERVDASSGQLSIENAKQSILNAQNELDSAGSDRPADIDGQAAAVRDAQAAVAIAQRKVDDAALRAPVAGVVSAVNGVTGEFVGAASGATALAPGSTAGLPGISDPGAAAAGAGGGASAGGGAFIVLNGVESFQLVVPFEESDAARIAPGQPVEVAVDAVAGLTRPGSVLAVAPSGEEVSGIVNYNATIVLTESDPRLRDGQTAEASVAVESVDGVLRVPSAVVRTEGGRSVVTSPASGEATLSTPFEPGVVGDQFIEVKSGLNEGQEVLLPQAQVTAVAGPPN